MSTVEDMRSIEVVEGVQHGAAEDPGSSATASRDADGHRTDVEWLAGRFVKQLIREAVLTRQGRDPSAPDPVVDWDSLWSIRAGATSKELGVGRVVVAAERLAHDIAEGRITPRRPKDSAKLINPATASPDPAVVPAAPAPPRPVDRSTVVAPQLAPSWTRGAVGSQLLPVERPLPPLILRRDTTVGSDSGSTSPRGSLRALRRQRLATAFAWVRNAGLALILFAGWQLWGTSLAQHQAQQTLQQQFTSRVREAPPTTSAGPSLVSADARVAEPAEGSVVAHLQIPAIGVDQYVVEGTAEGDLQKGPGHYIGTAMPGQAGNIAIAGHRTTYGAPFNNLDSMVPGDAIDLITDSGMTLDYVVTQAPVAVPPSDVKILNSFGDNRLTLTTCNPRYSASQRLVVVASLRTPVAPAIAASPAKAVQVNGRPRHVSTGGSVGWNMSYLPAVLAVLLAIVLLGLVNRRAAAHYGRVGRWLILVPIWVAATYLLFGLLSSFLPATL